MSDTPTWVYRIGVMSPSLGGKTMSTYTFGVLVVMPVMALLIGSLALVLEFLR